MSHAALILAPDALSSVYGEASLAHLRALFRKVTVITPSADWPRFAGELETVDVLFSGWGAPLMDDAFLQHTPRLRAVFYAGGSVRYCTTEAFWRRGIRLTTAQAINAIPVADFTVAALIMGLKRVWHYANRTREMRGFPDLRCMPGTYGSVIGLASYGTIARLVRARLRAFDLPVIVYDPFIHPDEAKHEQVSLVDLDELFSRADAVSLHTPHLPETVGLIRGRHLSRLRPGSFFLNTARGEVVAEAEMVDVLASRPDLTAMLDVTAPEPPASDSPLYGLPNVVLTPHIAGSIGRECLRMGRAMIDEYERYASGRPLQFEIDAQRAQILA